MKKKALLLLTGVAALACASFAFAACDGEPVPDPPSQPEHEHSYTQQSTDAQYLKSAADCSHKATYYYSCECGRKGKQTFESGDFAPHTYNQQNVDVAYLKSAADCANKAVYYYSCVCGEKGEETFEYGEPTGAHHYENGVCTNPGCGDEKTKLEYVLIDGGESYAVTGLHESMYTSATTTVYIPAQHDNRPVTAIGAEAFMSCSFIENFVLPNSITSIGRQAFSYCTHLTSIVVPNQVTVLETDVFWGCRAIESVTLHENITEICAGAFGFCSSLESISLPQSITKIGPSAFHGDASLRSLTIFQGIDVLRTGVVEGCTALETLTIPSGVIYIEGGAAKGCTALESVEVPLGVKFIGNNAFEDCTSLANIVLPDGLLSIDTNVFKNTAYYNNASNWDNGVLYCGKYLIEANKEVVSGSYTIRTGTVAIANSAFEECALLESVTRIGYHAFYGCTALTEATFENAQGWQVGFVGYPLDEETQIPRPNFSNPVNLSPSELSNPQTAAAKITDAYCRYCWAAPEQE